MPHEGLTGKSNCFANGCLGNAAVPFVENGLPIHAGGDLLVAKLKANNGSQNYALPAGVDLSRYNSVSIWCKSFDVTFAYAPLEPR